MKSAIEKKLEAGLTKKPLESSDIAQMRLDLETYTYKLNNLMNTVSKRYLGQHHIQPGDQVKVYTGGLFQDEKLLGIYFVHMLGISDTGEITYVFTEKTTKGKLKPIYLNYSEVVKIDQ